MADSENTQAQDSPDSSDEASPRERLPERLRVHSLARVLGTTSRRVLDALAELDGRARSAHSTVDKSQAERVREVLAGDGAAEAPTEALTEAQAAEAPAVEAVADAPSPRSGRSPR